jgi:enamine deaminase RidA (YjgF/YER057c/UK114 family)
MDESHVAKLYIYYSAAGEKSPEAARETVRKVQQEFYSGRGPAVTAIRVEGFAFEDLLIEIEAFAFK